MLYSYAIEMALFSTVFFWPQNTSAVFTVCKKTTHVGLKKRTVVLILIKYKMMAVK